MTQYKNKFKDEIVGAERSPKGYVFGGHEFPEGSFLIYEGGAVSKVLFANYFNENYKELDGEASKEEAPKAPKPPKV